MNLKRMIGATSMILASTLANAELLNFSAQQPAGYSSYTYPGLNLESLDALNIRVDANVNESNGALEYDIKRAEFKFPQANDLIVNGFEKVDGTSDTYRAMVNSPWVFKKVLVELKAYDFRDDESVQYRITVVDTTSSNDNLTQAQGVELFSGQSNVKDVTNKKVTDVVRTQYLGKNLTLRLYDRLGMQGAQVQAVWMGYGTEILNLDAPASPLAKAVTLHLDTQGPEPRIKASIKENNFTFDSAEQDLRFLLEQAFGPLPYPELP